MNIGKACAVFEQINSEKYEEQEKINAIKQVIEMPTHNGISKAEIMDAFRWFFNWAVEESNKKRTNADRVRNLTDEELAEFLSLVKYDWIYYYQGQMYSIDKEVWEFWLELEVEE